MLHPHLERPFLPYPQGTLRFLPSQAGSFAGATPTQTQLLNRGVWTPGEASMEASVVPKAAAPKPAGVGVLQNQRPPEAEMRPTWQQGGTQARPGRFWFVWLSIRTPKRVG